MSDVSDYLDNLVKQCKEEVDAATRFAEILILGMTVFGAALIAAPALLVLRSVTGSIQDVQRAVDDLRTGCGDLTYRLPPMKGEFDALSESLNQFISGLRDSATAIGSTSQQVEQGNRSLSERTEAQASGLEETAASMK